MFFGSRYSKLEKNEVLGFFKKLKAEEVTKFFSKNDIHEHKFGHRPLLYAVNLSEIDVVLALINMGADAFEESKSGGYGTDIPIESAISSNRPFYDIMQIAKYSRKEDWGVGNYRCIVAAGGRPDTQMLQYLNEAGAGLKNPNTSLGSPQTAMSKAIEQGPVQNVKYLHDLGCSYPERHRASFHMIFEDTAKSEFNSHWWTNSINDFDLTSTQSEPWKKLTFLILNGVVEVSFLREQLSRRGIRKHVIDSFWSSFEKAYAEREKIVDSNELSDLDDRPDVDVEVIQRMYDNSKKLVTRYRVKIREKF